MPKTHIKFPSPQINFSPTSRVSHVSPSEYCRRVYGLALLLLMISVVPLRAAALEIQNGNFEHWTADTPDGWTVAIGARNGADEPASEVKRMPGPAIFLRGTAKTLAWRSVSQEVALEPGKSYRLDFEARSKGVKREGKQFDNCYVGFLSTDAQGKVVGQAVKDLSAETADWEKHSVSYQVPSSATSTSITLFLSKTGLVAVKNVAIAAHGDKAPSDANTSPSNTNLLINGDFKLLESDRPTGWQVDVGAKNGADTPLSSVSPLPDGGIELRGDATTLAWNNLMQDVKVDAGKTYTLRYEAKSENVRREGNQYDNCYVGVMLFDDNAKRLDIKMQDLSKQASWKKGTLRFTAPPTATKASVMVFLSKSGSLQVKSLDMQEATPVRPFRGTP
jgi:hypothetical protein